MSTFSKSFSTETYGGLIDDKALFAPPPIHKPTEVEQWNGTLEVITKKNDVVTIKDWEDDNPFNPQLNTKVKWVNTSEKEKKIIATYMQQIYAQTTGVSISKAKDFERLNAYFNVKAQSDDEFYMVTVENSKTDLVEHHPKRSKR